MRVDLMVEVEVVVCFVEWMVRWREGSEGLYTGRGGRSGKAKAKWVVGPCEEIRRECQPILT
jgi:hypothetical protein